MEKIVNFLLQTSTKSGKSELIRVNYLDGWRGLAISFVLVAHFLGWTGFFNFGRFGVDVFFVLSGMLMSNILFVKRVPLSVFYKKRISRIFPVFILFILVIYSLGWILVDSNEHSNIFYTLTFLRSYLPISPTIWNTDYFIGHLWSLNIEEHSYILLSLLTLIPLFKKNEHILLLALGMGCILLTYFYVRFPDLAPPLHHVRTEIAASHILISAGYFLIKYKLEPYVPSWLPLLTFILSLYCYSSSSVWYANWLLSPFLLAFTVNHLNLLPKFALYILELKILRLLGLWSFSIYLWQQPFYGIIKGQHIEFFGDQILMLFFAVAVGGLSFWFIENPVRKFLNNKW
jgi:peptidoglycan/LPS O-acetylase OafA/YrhL